MTCRYHASFSAETAAAVRNYCCQSNRLVRRALKAQIHNFYMRERKKMYNQRRKTFFVNAGSFFLLVDVEEIRVRPLYMGPDIQTQDQKQSIRKYQPFSENGSGFVQNAQIQILIRNFCCSGEDPFLRGLLLNVGFLESLTHLPFRLVPPRSSVLFNCISMYIQNGHRKISL